MKFFNKIKPNNLKLVLSFTLIIFTATLAAQLTIPWSQVTNTNNYKASAINDGSLQTSPSYISLGGIKNGVASDIVISAIGGKSIVFYGNTSISQNLTVQGTISASNIVGNGSGLTNVAGWNISGSNTSTSQNIGIGLSGVPSYKLDVGGDIRGNCLRGTSAIITSKVGIGIASSIATGSLSIKDNSTFNSEWNGAGILISNNEYGNTSLRMGTDLSKGISYIQSMHINLDWDAPLILQGTGGNVAIGTTTSSNAKLRVKGKVLAEEFEIVTNVDAADYVFEETYQLRTLDEVEKYITDNNHLPDVPSAAQFKEKGYKIVEMDNTLIRKLEELTLYTIELNKQVEALKLELAKVKGGK